MKVIELSSTNGYGVLKKFQIHLNDDVTEVSGQNGSGKSHFRMAIEEFCGGKAAAHLQPGKDGEKPPEFTIKLGKDGTPELIGRVHYTKSGSRVVHVYDANGEEMKGGAQAIIDRLISDRLMPFEGFTMASDAEQQKILQQVVKLPFDLGALKRKRDHHYNDRTIVNREVARLKALIPDDIEEVAPVDTEALMGEREKLAEEGRYHEKQIDEVDRLAAGVERQEGAVAELRERLKEAEGMLTTMREEHEERQAKLDHARRNQLVALVADVDGQIKAASETNRKAKAWEDCQANRAALSMKQDESSTYTAHIVGIDSTITEGLAAIEYPIEGMAMNEDGKVTFNGLPLRLVSTGERVPIDVAVMAVYEPSLNLYWVRDASCMDSTSKRAAVHLAREHGVQLVLEYANDAPPTNFNGIFLTEGEVTDPELYEALRIQAERVAEEVE